MRSSRGFTLVEISIVLLIIGLIAGGVLVAREMIEVARIRSTITQLERYQTAVSAFRVKYNAVPGDLTTEQASRGQFAPIPRATSGQPGNHSIDNFATYARWEGVHFWQDLSTAKLISENFSRIQDSLESYGSQDAAFADTLRPLAKIPGAVWLMGRIAHNSASDIYTYVTSYYVLTGRTGINSDSFIAGQGLTAAQAYGIDSKIDDGVSYSGRVMDAIADTSTIGYDPIAGYASRRLSNPCVNNANPVATATYNVNQAGVTCTLVFKSGLVESRSDPFDPSGP